MTTGEALKATESAPPALPKKVLHGIYTPFLEGGGKGEPKYIYGFAVDDEQS